MDTVSTEKRHEIMSKIKGKETTIENKVRLYLYHHGIRYRKNTKTIPGTPDISIKKYKIAIFVNGCFWHGHQDCKYFRIPKTNVEYWTQKITRNIERDQEVKIRLESEGWTVITIWECQLKSSFEETMVAVLTEIYNAKTLHKQVNEANQGGI
jgi:DNA mismatch endonuclease, patch repair protein